MSGEPTDRYSWACWMDRKHAAWAKFLQFVTEDEANSEERIEDTELAWDTFKAGWAAHDWHQNGPK